MMFTVMIRCWRILPKVRHVDCWLIERLVGKVVLVIVELEVECLGDGGKKVKVEVYLYFKRTSG